MIRLTDNLPYNFQKGMSGQEIRHSKKKTGVLRLGLSMVNGKGSEGAGIESVLKSEE